MVEQNTVGIQKEKPTDKTKWKGESRGGPIGYKIFIFLLKYLGLGFAYFILRFVAFYFVLFSGKAFASIYYYFRHVQEYSGFKSLLSIYKNYYVFGQTILDKVVLLAGLKGKYKFDFDGRQDLEGLVSQNKGGILISAHVGNFEMAAKSLNHLETSISVVTIDAERKEIKEVLDESGASKGLNFIPISPDGSHLFKIASAIAEGGLVCFTGDRYKEGDRVLTSTLMGRPAKFPAGPFEIASRLNTPVLFVFGMKKSSKMYQFYARAPKVEGEITPQKIVDEFTRVVENIIKKYPLQWFNYFDFWETLKK